MAGIVISELLAVVGIEADKKSVDGVTAMIDGVKNGVIGLGAALVGGAVAAGITSFAAEMVDTASNLTNLAARTDLTTSELQRMSTFTKTMGVDMNALGVSVEKVGLKFAEAAKDGGATAAFFRGIGLDVKDSEGNVKTGSAALLDYLDAVAAIPNAAERARALNKIDDTFRAFGPAVANGKNELREFLVELGEMEGLEQDTIRTANELELEHAKLGLAMTSVKNIVAKGLLPPLVSMVKWVARLASGFVRWTRATMDVLRQSALLEVLLVGLGIALTALALSYTAAGLAAAKAGLMAAAAWAAANWPIALTVAAIALVILVVEDLVTLFRGGKSVIGEFIDELFGVGTAEAVVKAVSKAFEDLVGWVTDAMTWLGKLFGMVGETPPAYEPGEYVPTREEIDALKQAAARLQGEQALLAANPQSLGVAPTTARAPATAGGSSKSLTQHTEVQILVQGNPSADERRRIEQVVDQALERRNRAAADDLLQEGGE